MSTIHPETAHGLTTWAIQANRDASSADRAMRVMEARMLPENLTLARFGEGLIAAFAIAGITSISTRNNPDRRKLLAIVDFIGKQISEDSLESPSDWDVDLTRIRNNLQPDDAGALWGFEELFSFFSPGYTTPYEHGFQIIPHANVFENIFEWLSSREQQLINDAIAIHKET